MTESDVLKNAFSMPIHSPSFPRGPYRFINREYLIITYRTDPELLEALLPAPLKLAEPVVKYEFINMPDSTGFGHYCESGQVIPVTLNGVHGGFVLSMFLNDESPIAGGRELWGFPKEYGKPKLRVKKDTLIGTLDCNGIQIARGTMGYKHVELPHDKVLASMLAPNFLLKVIPHVDGTPRICELVQYELTDVTIKGAWTGPSSLDLHSHALAPISLLPVREIVSATHILADLTLPYGRVVHDYLPRFK